MSRFIKIGADGAQLEHDAIGHVAIIDTKANLMWSAGLSISDKLLTFAEVAPACAALELASFKDWRAPTVEELFLLADRTKFDPAIDTDAFPDVQGWYWTSTIDPESPSGSAFYVDFGNGAAHLLNQNGRGRVLAVRSCAAAAGQ